MTEERIQQLVSQAWAARSVSDPRGQIEMTVRQAIKEASGDVPRQPPQRYDVYAEMGNRNDEVPLVESTPSENGEWVMWDDIASLFNSPRQEGGK